MLSRKVDVPIVEVFKAKVVVALSKLLSWKVSLPISRSWNQVSLRSLPTQAILWFCDTTWLRELLVLPQTIQVLASKITTAVVKQWFWYLQWKNWDLLKDLGLHSFKSEIGFTSDNTNLWWLVSWRGKLLCPFGSDQFHWLLWHRSLREKMHRPCPNQSSNPTKHFHVASIWKATKTESVAVFWAFTSPAQQSLTTVESWALYQKVSIQHFWWNSAMIIWVIIILFQQLSSALI